MDNSNNKYSSAWRADNAFSRTKKFKVVGEKLGDGVDVGVEAGSVRSSESEAKKEIQDAIKAIEDDIRTMKRGDFNPIGLYGKDKPTEEEAKEWIGEWENMLRIVKQWKVEPVFGS